MIRICRRRLDPWRAPAPLTALAVAAALIGAPLWVEVESANADHELACDVTIDADCDAALTAAGDWGLLTRSDISDDTPLVEVPIEEAAITAAGRLIVAIDALAELDAFVPFAEPELEDIIRSIRDEVPADGITPEGHLDELQRFVNDLVPFLEDLEDSGVLVSEDLWIAIESIEFGGLDELANGRTQFLDAFPWLAAATALVLDGGSETLENQGFADLLVIEELLDQYLDLISFEAAVTPAPSDEVIVSSAADDPVDDPAESRTEGGSTPSAEPDEPAAGGAPIALFVVGGLVGLVVIGLLFARRRGTTPNADDRLGRPVEPVTNDVPARRADERDRAAPDLSLTDLLDASRRMTSALDSNDIAEIALGEATRLVEAEGGLVVRRTLESFEILACEPVALFHPDRVGEGSLRRLFDTGQSSASIATDDPALAEVPSAVAAVPIVANGIVSGALMVVRVAATPFERKEIDALEMLAPLVGSAFAAADTHESATDLMDIEPLTGLQNRRRLDRDLASLDPDEQVAYVMIDVDHFKNFNDTNGHAAGDEALQQVSAILSASVRPGDLVYRYGGEEFCVLLPGATATDAAAVAERARAAVESAPIPGRENQPDGRVTISIGVSESAWATPSELIEKADAALYEAKRAGRNQVKLSDPFTDPTPEELASRLQS